MAQAVSHQPLTVKAQVRAWVSPSASASDFSLWVEQQQFFTSLNGLLHMSETSKAKAVAYPFSRAK
jgi:hypothetical protein